MKLEASWYRELKEEIALPYVHHLKEFLEMEKRVGKTVYPPDALVFNAFKQTPYACVKAVIVGQDPYHGPGQAHGLSFSVPIGVPPPPSLKNIYKELQNDLGIAPPDHGCLLKWAHEGVLLLNATLTVRRGEPRSHYGKGWERFTDAVIARLLQRDDPIAFMLWGKAAQEKVPLARGPHAMFTAAHPSPYSAHAGFFGCRHFSKVNRFLEASGKGAIDWRLP
jgi:uracil-DNA glycosylase